MKTLCFVLLLHPLFTTGIGLTAGELPRTRVALREGRWIINDRPSNPGSAAEGLLMNVRMVNAVFEDRSKPDFDPEANADRFISKIPDYAAHGVNAFTICLQGGMPGYEGAVNSAFEPDGSLRPAYLARAERIIRACDRHGVVVILGLYYQRQSRILRDEAAVRAGVVNAARWIQSRGFRNVAVEVANEYPHNGFAHELIRDPKGQASLVQLVKETVPGLLVTASGYGDGKVHAEVAEACDFLTPHWNGTKIGDIPARVAWLKRFGKPIVCNEDDRVGESAAAAMRAGVTNGCAYGLMLKEHNQTFPFHFDGAADDPVYYAALKTTTSVKEHAEMTPSESAVEWTVAVNPAKRTRCKRLFIPTRPCPSFSSSVAKLVSYTLLGALLGWLGSYLSLSPTTRAILMIAIGVFMVGNALRMFNVHPIFRYFSFEPPKFITRYIRRTAKGTDTLTPLFLGFLTVFIPCGVTQAMMAAALGTGSALMGAALMFAFTLGTSPVFFLIAYLATELGSRMEKYFMRFVAVVVLVLGLVTVNGGLGFVGLVAPPKSNFSAFILYTGIRQERFCLKNLTSRTAKFIRKT